MFISLGLFVAVIFICKKQSHKNSPIHEIALDNIYVSNREDDVLPSYSVSSNIDIDDIYETVQEHKQI